MTRKQTQLLGALLLLSALLALCVLLPGLIPSRLSVSGLTIIKRPDLVRMALGYLGAGLAAGFGLALLLWPWMLRKPNSDL